MIHLEIASKADLFAGHFSIHESLSTPFTLTLQATTPDPSLDLSSIVGHPATFRLQTGLAFAAHPARTWTGICSFAEQLQAEPSANGLSTYHFRIVPTLWLLTQRRNHRIFQHLTIPDIASALLAEWGIQPTWHIHPDRYPKLEYKVQYGETDYAFFSRLLEEAGITFTFTSADEEAHSNLTLADAPHLADPRALPLPYVDNPNESAEMEFITAVRLAHQIRPGAHTLRDYDFRRPAHHPTGEAPFKPASPEDRLEQYHYHPGASLIETPNPADTPIADAQGTARHEHTYARTRAERALHAHRTGRQALSFDTNAHDLRPGTVFSLLNHPHGDIPPGRKLLVTELSIEGAPGEPTHISGRAVFADTPYRPPLVTKKPILRSVQCATVTGPAGQEIHTDEFGRVRVQFPWDRHGKHDDHSSCWIRANQGWGGRGYGMQLLPRIGQEVLISFLDGDPDQPILVGRVFNQTNPVPYKLPENKTISTWKSDSSQGSDGFNEVKFEDRKGDELLYQQAQKNQRALVKHDETITVLRHREKHVGADETDTTGVHRTEVTGANRTENTGANRATLVVANRAKLVRGEESARTEGRRKLRAGADLGIVVKGKKREKVDDDSHLDIKGDRSERIEGTQSLVVVGDRQEKVRGRHALAAGKQIHLVAGEAMVGEAGDVTVKGPGGFIRIDAGGVTIKGVHVSINAGGKKGGKGRGAKPEKPEEQ